MGFIENYATIVNPRRLLGIFDIDLYPFLLVIFVTLCLVTGLCKNSIDIISEQQAESVVSMHSLDYRYVLVGEITIATLLLVEASIDFFSNAIRIHSVKGSMVNFAILITILVGSTIIFFAAIPNSDYYLIFVFRETRFVLVVGAILSYSHRVGKHIWRCRFLLISTIIGAIGCYLQIFQDMSRTNIDDPGIVTLFVQWIMANVFDVKSLDRMNVPYLISVEVSFTSFVVIQFLYQTRLIRKESSRQK
eukprot:gene9199-19070_t